MFGTHENGTFKFWGLDVKQSKDGIIIDQNLCVSLISPTEIKKEILEEKYGELLRWEKWIKKTYTLNNIFTQTHLDAPFNVYRMSNTGKIS